MWCDDCKPEMGGCEVCAIVEGDPTARYCPQCIVHCQDGPNSCTMMCCPAHHEHDCLHVLALAGEGDDGMYDGYTSGEY